MKSLVRPSKPVLLNLNFFAACDEFVALAILSPANWLRLSCRVEQIGNLRPIGNRPPAYARAGTRPLQRLVCSTALLFIFAAMLPAAEEYSYWIEDCSPALNTGCEPGDAELGRWALEAWRRESGGAIMLKKSSGEEHARLRLHWANGTSGLYGETEPILVDGKRGANIYVLPSIGPGRSDPLMRDAIVYLTCLHESGHALGLVHTRAFADIMYSFQYGGDITAYFQRYRVLLKTRADIAAHSGISDADRVALRLALKQ